MSVHMYLYASFEFEDHASIFDAYTTGLPTLDDTHSHVTTLVLSTLTRQCELDPSCTFMVGECRRFRLASMPILEDSIPQQIPLSILAM